ncbi:hypothetical protein RF11_15807 [Thelohanellus kitauei]|uniref:Uncharacterized protein n=1 Tax=Thelohanellus kitauei TaxID=669202 RepID=A0A0C2MWK4_THEKT|nr:hypothetical protein RF11_15807 [Thelohanellus kitauei]
MLKDCLETPENIIDDRWMLTEILNKASPFTEANLMISNLIHLLFRKALANNPKLNKSIRLDHSFRASDEYIYSINDSSIMDHIRISLHTIKNFVKNEVYMDVRYN